jgi:hypothetical protein
MISVAVGLSETTRAAAEASRGNGAPKSSSSVESIGMLRMVVALSALRADASLVAAPPAGASPGDVQLAPAMQSSMAFEMQMILCLREKNKGRPLYEKTPEHA